MQTWAEQELDRLKAEAPEGWALWYIDQSRGPSGIRSWHAMPPGGVRAAIATDNPR
jgi:predicted RNA-binding Zn ribbon-like protein